MYVRFLNKEVEEKVKSNYMFYIAWCLKYDKYDDEIEPLHNKDWVEVHQKYEEENLKYLEDEINLILKELNSE